MPQMNGISKDRREGGPEEIWLPAHPFNMKKRYLDYMKLKRINDLKIDLIWKGK